MRTTYVITVRRIANNEIDKSFFEIFLSKLTLTRNNSKILTDILYHYFVRENLELLEYTGLNVRRFSS